MRGISMSSLLLALGAIAGCEAGQLSGWIKGGDPAGGGGSTPPPRLVDSGPGGGGDVPPGDPGGGGAPDGSPGGGGEPDAGPPVDPSDPCMGLDYLGRCDGDTARWCEEGGMLRSRDCASMGHVCRWIDDQPGYYCASGEAGG